MPNWCENDLVITGPENSVAELKRLVASEALVFDFECILPMPPELAELSFGSIMLDGKQYECWRVIDGKDVGVSTTELNYLVKKYGASNWYDWAIKYWGTKWNASEPSLEEHKPTRIVYHFATAWSPPLPIMQALAARFPLVNFTLRYYEGGMGYKGKLQIRCGEVVDHIEGDYRGPRGG